jgi:SAM-dependent methyltransferase
MVASAQHAVEQIVRQCPLCRAPFQGAHAGAVRCSGCGHEYRQSHGQWDFRLPATAEVSYALRYAPIAVDTELAAPVEVQRKCPEPRNRYQGTAPTHLSEEAISYIVEGDGTALALDLGCGDARNRPVLEALGYQYLGADIAGTGASDLVDAHALPYADTTFDLVMGIALVEHVAQPLRVFSEVRRVLRPGGAFIATAAFLEPHHDNSFAHLSHVGLWYYLTTAGLRVETIQVDPRWHVARSQLTMGPGAKLPWWLSRAVTAPFAWGLDLYSAAGRRLGDRARHERGQAFARHAGSFLFVARSP